MWSQVNTTAPAAGRSKVGMCSTSHKWLHKMAAAGEASKHIKYSIVPLFAA